MTTREMHMAVSVALCSHVKLRLHAYFIVCLVNQTIQHRLILSLSLIPITVAFL